MLAEQTVLTSRSTASASLVPGQAEFNGARASPQGRDDSNLSRAGAVNSRSTRLSVLPGTDSELVPGEVRGICSTSELSFIAAINWSMASALTCPGTSPGTPCSRNEIMTAVLTSRSTASASLVPGQVEFIAAGRHRSQGHPRREPTLQRGQRRQASQRTAAPECRKVANLPDIRLPEGGPWEEEAACPSSQT